KEIELNEVTKLLQSNFHEYRFVGLVIVTLKFNKASNLEKKQLYHFYLENISAVNNWDLVDTSAPQVIGEYLLDHPADRDILYKFAHSDDLWLKRIAMLSTFTFIRDEEYEDALKIAKILVYDDHDLIHKAVGWMLREIGNRDLRTEEQFLQKYASTMPRTMLRYAIEKFPENKRQKYLKAT
ncbi:DNA alkylation repair protein, partial [candidate division WWE3 bacterium]|nr:DNA alkylation repair protein [candidate division WWE3 bacterium]